MEPLKDSRWLAGICGVGVQTVYRWQSEGSGPVFTRLDSQRARYRVADVEHWLWERRTKIAA